MTSTNKLILKIAVMDVEFGMCDGGEDEHEGAITCRYLVYLQHRIKFFWKSTT